MQRQPSEIAVERHAAALRRLPVTHSLALRLRAAGVDDALLAECLAIEPEAVGPLLAVAAAKLDALLQPDRSTSGRGPGAGSGGVEPRTAGTAREGPMRLRLNQVKVPVTDLQRSVSWYRALLGLDLWREFVEDGVLCGAVLSGDDDRDLRLGLRLRDAIAGRPRFPGFDLFSIAVDSLEELRAITARCDALGIRHGEMIELGSDGTIVDVPDPDETVIRFIHLGPARDRRFGGVRFRADDPPSFYEAPRLRA
jgi:catechol 2,3-dioxygenase-like lactoylglutathione lyase family enzyme